MDILLAYDVATDTTEGRRRLRHVANACVAYGQRVQKSVFECSLTSVQLERLEHRLLGIVNPKEDSLRIYRLPETNDRHRRIYGLVPDVDFDEPLII
jgi:CRISPR-associated protein Cas2